jgi:hypothetical protein
MPIEDPRDVPLEMPSPKALQLAGGRNVIMCYRDHAASQQWIFDFFMTKAHTRDVPPLALNGRGLTGMSGVTTGRGNQPARDVTRRDATPQHRRLGLRDATVNAAPHS